MSNLSFTSVFHRCQFVLWLLTGFIATSAYAQTGGNSGLAGRVTDTSGASMAGVTVMVTRPEAGFERTTSSSAAGDWEARFLPPGTYRVSFEHRGFKTLQREGVVVTTGQLATVDVVLEVGDISESVAVTADGRMVTADSAAIARTLDRKELEALPTSARNITQLLAIEPGVSADISELLSNDNASISPSVNGARTTNNSFVFNGIDVTNMLCCNSRINGSRGTIDAGGGTLSRNIAPAPGNARRSETADKPVRRFHRPQRRRHLPGGFEERHELLFRHGVPLFSGRRAAGE